MEILEGIEDDALARDLLKRFNDSSSLLGRLVLNLDESLGHEEWKRQCDQAQRDLEQVLEEIYRHR